jgi:hypothetical protein
MTVGSVFSHSTWVSALSRLSNLQPDVRSDHVVLAIAANLGVNYEYIRAALPKMNPAAREQLAEILASDPRQEIILNFLHTLNKFAEVCRGTEASFAILFRKFLQLSCDGKFRRQDIRTRNENRISAIKALDAHLGHCHDNPSTLALLHAERSALASLLNPAEVDGHTSGWIGTNLYVALHHLAIDDIIPNNLRPESTGNQYNSLLRLASIGKAPDAASLNQKLVDCPNHLSGGHLAYAIQNPDLDLPHDHIARSAIAFDVLSNWIKNIRFMDLPEPHGPERLLQIIRTIVEHKPGMVDKIISSNLDLPGLLEIESLREAKLQRDLGL